jgi:hypothetical protein
LDTSFNGTGFQAVDMNPNLSGNSDYLQDLVVNDNTGHIYSSGNSSHEGIELIVVLALHGDGSLNTAFDGYPTRTWYLSMLNLTMYHYEHQKIK